MECCILVVIIFIKGLVFVLLWVGFKLKSNFLVFVKLFNRCFFDILLICVKVKFNEFFLECFCFNEVI